MADHTTTHGTQQSVRASASFSGTGLFTGLPSRFTIHPAGPDTGIVFRRADLAGNPSVPARAEFATDRQRRTALQHGEAVIETVEHCLSALSGLGIDNALIDVDAAELPAGDGSAKPFVETVMQAGIQAQNAPRRPLVIREPIAVSDGDATVTALPGPTTEYMYALDYGEGAPIHKQVHLFEGDADAYAREIAPARTFSTRHEAEAARSRGLFAHLSPRDMLVIDHTGPIENTYRYADEPVRHKLVDLIGDLALVGRPIVGRIVAVKSGHALNVKLARELVEHERLAPGAAPAMDIRSILSVLPHRFPMVMVDRVLEMESGRRAVGVKNVTFNEPFFQGHYPEKPIMPGVLILEAMSQLAGLMLKDQLDRDGKVGVLLSFDGVKFRKAVVPGDQLVMETEAIKVTSRLGEVECRAFVGGQLAAEAQVKFLMVPADGEP